MSNVCDQFAEKGRKEVLHCFVENALALGMEPAMVAQIADSSDPFVQAMIAAPDTAQRRTPDVCFCVERSSGNGISMKDVFGEIEASAARSEVYRLTCHLETEDAIRALSELPNPIERISVLFGIDGVTWGVACAEGMGKEEGEREAARLISDYIEGSEVPELAKCYRKTETEVVELLEEATVYARRYKRRDPKRIKEFCDQLAEIWESQCPDWRFGQLISNVFPQDPFYHEEEELLRVFKEYFNLDK